MNSYDDNFFMKEALKMAKIAFDDDEVPVGAVLVHNNKVISKGYNQVERLKDATAHAEMICITAGFNYFNDWRLDECVLYTTLEPCLMCAGAIYQARIKKIVWGAKDLRLGANGSWIDVFDKNHPMHKVEVVSNILADEAAFLMQSFFQNRELKF